MLNKLNILFYLKKSKSNDNGNTAPLYCRITIKNQRAEISTSQVIPIKHWDPDKQRVKCGCKDFKGINSHLEQLELTIRNKYNELPSIKKYISSKELKFNLTEVTQPNETLKSFLAAELKKTHELVGRSLTIATYKTLLSTVNHLEAFCHAIYGRSEISFNSIDYSFVDQFFHYLRSEKKIGNNSSLKYLKTFKKITKQAIILGHLEKDPFLSFKAKYSKVNRQFLTEDELRKLFEKDLKNERLNLVKEVFLFQCLTGLAYIDIKNLSWENITKKIIIPLGLTQKELKPITPLEYL